jgi:hypothetical protein
MMYFNVLYHFYMSFQRIIFAKATTGAMGRDGDKTGRTGAEEIFGGCLLN